MYTADLLWPTLDDWFDQGKTDAWAGRSKCPPEEDVLAASLYDLGFSEGAIKRSHLSKILPHSKKPQTHLNDS
jgi:hypothetical protein